MAMTQAKREHHLATPKAGKSRSLHSSDEGLCESDKERHYKDTTHNYYHLIEYKKQG